MMVVGRKRPSVRRKYAIIITVLILLSVALIITVSVLATRRQESSPCVGACAAAAYLTGLANFSADPCEDFYEFACGQWTQQEIPKYRDTIDPTARKVEEINDKLLDIFSKKMYIKNEDHEIVKSALRYFDACTDMESVNRTGIPAILAFLNETGVPPMINPDWNADEFDWLEMVATMQVKAGVSVLIRPQLSPDYSNTSRFLMQLGRTSLASFGPSGETRSYYKVYVLNFLSYFVNTDLNMKEVFMQNVTSEVVDFEDELRKLYSATVPNPAERKLIKDLNSEIPGVDWVKYFRTVTNNIVTEDDVVYLGDPGYLRNLVEFMKDEDVKRRAANYIAWQLIAGLVNVLPKQYQEFFHKYTTENIDIETPTNRNSVCLTILHRDFKYLMDHLYVAHFFDHDDLVYVRSMANTLREEFQSLLNNSDWMDDESKNRALTKLDKLRIQLAYDDFLANITLVAELYEPLKSIGVIGNEAVKNELIMKAFNTRHGFSLLKEPRRLDLTRAASVDAAYDRGLNALGVSAGMFSAPQFYPGAPHYVNYGAIGSVIGHELTHAYDILGRERDEDGIMNQWWSNTANEEYLKRTKCFIDQYSDIAVRLPLNTSNPDNGEYRYLNLKGGNTIQENFADNNGIILSYNAYQSWLKNNRDNVKLPGLEHFTKEQLFFLAFAKTHCQNINAGRLEFNIRQGRYSPNQYRVIGPLRNFEQFSKAFQCGENSGMSIKNKCIMW